MATSPSESKRIIDLKRINKTLKKIGDPKLSEKEAEEFVDFNWIVDGILKNSTPYETRKSQRNSSKGIKPGK